MPVVCPGAGIPTPSSLAREPSLPHPDPVSCCLPSGPLLSFSSLRLGYPGLPEPVSLNTPQPEAPGPPGSRTEVCKGGLVSPPWPNAPSHPWPSQGRLPAMSPTAEPPLYLGCHSRPLFKAADDSANRSDEWFQVPGQKPLSPICPSLPSSGSLCPAAEILAALPQPRAGLWGLSAPCCGPHCTPAYLATPFPFHADTSPGPPPRETSSLPAGVAPAARLPT